VTDEDFVAALKFNPQDAQKTAFSGLMCRQRGHSIAIPRQWNRLFFLYVEEALALSESFFAFFLICLPSSR
jgi:hypothetical protein